MDYKFEVGDVVQLASGSPPMTVFSLGQGQEKEMLANTIWFFKDEPIPYTGSFRFGILRAVEEG